MIAALLSDLWPYLAGLLALIGGGLVAYLKGRGDGAAKAETKATKDALKTIERIEDAKAASSAGGAAWHDRLRDHTK